MSHLLMRELFTCAFSELRAMMEMVMCVDGIKIFVQTFLRRGREGLVPSLRPDGD